MWSGMSNYNITKWRQFSENASWYEMDDPGYSLRFNVTTTTLLSVAYGIVFILGLVGNGFVVGVVWRCRAMRSPTNLFIVNLAFADLLVIALCLPFTLVGNLIPAWILGGVICKAVSYLQGVSVSASIGTLMAISGERCVAITSTTLRGPMTPRQCCGAVCLIWSFALIVNVPWLLVFTLEPIGINGSVALVCTENWPSQESENLYFIVANLCLCYLIPLLVISVCYLLIWRRLCMRRLPGEAFGGQSIINRSKIKAIKMILVVIVTFAISWMPLYVLFFIIKFGLAPSTDYAEHVILTLIPISQWLGAANSCVNPIYYAYFNRKFRIGFKAILMSRSCCTPLRFDKCSSCYSSSYRCSARQQAHQMPLAHIRREKYTLTKHLLESQDSSTADNSIASKNQSSMSQRSQDQPIAPLYQVKNGTVV